MLYYLQVNCQVPEWIAKDQPLEYVPAERVQYTEACPIFDNLVIAVCTSVIKLHRLDIDAGMAIEILSSKNTWVKVYQIILEIIKQIVSSPKGRPRFKYRG